MRIPSLVVFLALLLTPACSDGGGTTSASAVVGAQGGEVQAAGATVVIPAGALDAETTIGVATAQPAAAVASGYARVGSAYAFTPHGTTFSEPVTLRLPYPSGRTGLEVQRLDDEQDTTWESVTATFDAGVATVEVTSFSLYQVVGPAEAPGPDVDFDVLKVDAELLFYIDPAREYGQYFGTINFTEVTSEVPSGVTVPIGVAVAARGACASLWDELAQTGIAAVHVYVIRDNGELVSLNTQGDGFWVPEAGGNWTSRGGNAESGDTVEARAGFWDPHWNRRSPNKLTSVDYQGDTINVHCFTGEDVQLTYP